MAEDPLVHWVQVNPFGLLRDETQDAWNAGNVRDVLQLDSGAVVIATETGGVWMIIPGQPAVSLSGGWDHPDVDCLGFGPDGPRHLYAGTADGVLWETDVTNALPLLTWKTVPNLPDTGPIYTIAVVRPHRWIVLACDKGIFWSPIPSGSAGQYSWKRAIDDPQVPAGYRYFDLALAATDPNGGEGWQEDLASLTVVAGGMGLGQDPGGIFVGRWDAGDLVMKRSLLFDPDGRDITPVEWAMGPVSVDAATFLPTFVYALCSQKSMSVMMVARSEDGGQTFQQRGTKVRGSAKDLVALAGPHGGDRQNCIAVSTWDADYVAIGWTHGPFASKDGGMTWLQVSPSSPHLHADIHAVYFAEDPPNPNPVRRLYVGSDGGLASTEDLATLDGRSFRSDYNRELPNHQCGMQQQPRGFYSSLGASLTEDGLVALGVQDNGNVYCVFGQVSTPWRQLDGGDGGLNLLVDSYLARNVAGQTPDRPSQLAIWNGVSFDSKGVIPVTSAGSSGPPAPQGIASPRGAVSRERFSWPGAPSILAAVASGSDVYGLCLANPPSGLEWRYLASVPLASGATIASVAPVPSGTIFAGSTDGRIFVLDPGRVSEMQIQLPPPSPTTSLVGGGALDGIAAATDTDAFAVLNGVSWQQGGTVWSQNYVMALDSQGWRPVTSGLPPDQTFYALELDWTHSPSVVFVATDRKVYVSRNAGASWDSASEGLPVRPHCADLRFVGEKRGDYLYLGTWGRSVWVSRLNADIGVAPFM
ncbi:MAG: hypothetical protein M3Q23_10455 [Actinomycetota bacterium]|nr:hypothetical protein [Actinomycetota bacterium]